MNQSLRAVIEARYDKCVSRVVHRLRRVPVNGLFGDDFPARTLWDLWKREMQEQHSSGHRILEDTVEEHIALLVEGLSQEEGVLLTLLTDEVDELEEGEDPGFYPDAVTRELTRRVNSRASNEPHRKEIQQLLGDVVRDRHERDMEPYL